MSDTIRHRMFPACAILLIAAVAAFAEPSADPAQTEEKTDMKSTTATARRAAIPPIDAAAPAKTETATFALG